MVWEKIVRHGLLMTKILVRYGYDMTEILVKNGQGFVKMCVHYFLDMCKIWVLDR